MCLENQGQSKSVRLPDEVLKLVTGGGQDRITNLSGPECTAFRPDQQPHDHLITLQCPGCAHPILVTLFQLVNDKCVSCPLCGFSLTFDQ